MEKKCLSKCFKKNTTGFHPISHNSTIKKNYDFCFTDLFEVDKVKKCDIEKTYKNSYLPNIMLFNEKNVLNNIYNIHEWHDILESFLGEKSEKYENIETLNRILKYSWIVFENKWYNEILNIIEIYKKYFTTMKKNISDKKINDFIFSLKNEYINKTKKDTKNFHKLIIDMK